MPFRDIKQLDTEYLDSNLVNTLLESVEKRGKLTGIPPLRVQEDAGGYTVFFDGQANIFAKITDTDGTFYSWEEIDQTPDGVIEVRPGGLIGTLNARELDDNFTVTGTNVRLYRGIDSPELWLFENCCGIGSASSASSK